MNRFAEDGPVGAACFVHLAAMTRALWRSAKQLVRFDTHEREMWGRAMILAALCDRESQPIWRDPAMASLLAELLTDPPSDKPRPCKPLRPSQPSQRREGSAWSARCHP